MNLLIENLIPIVTSQAVIGQKYNRLTVTKTGRTNNPIRYYAICTCDCGKTDIPVQIARIKNGTTKSCGCFNRDNKTTHGLYYQPIYQRWYGMMDRCYNVDKNNYSDYGGRGITVCPEWHDPNKFISDMQSSFSEELQLDRRDTNANYNLENCRWITQKENLDNRRNTVMITYQGITQSLLQWSKEFGINRKLLAKRICERKWSPERAFTTPALSKTECAKVANAASQIKKLSP